MGSRPRGSRPPHPRPYGLGFFLRHLAPQGPFEGELVEANTSWVRRDLTREGEARVEVWESLARLPARPALLDRQSAHPATPGVRRV